MKLGEAISGKIKGKGDRRLVTILGEGKEKDLY